LFVAWHPRVFTDPVVGSGTSIEVGPDIGIEAYGLDPHAGFNILKQRILDAVGKPSDPVLSTLLPQHHRPLQQCLRQGTTPR
jgi:hypothetical protein